MAFAPEHAYAVRAFQLECVRRVSITVTAGRSEVGGAGVLLSYPFSPPAPSAYAKLRHLRRFRHPRH
jgi:hypothetical protein